MIVEPRRRKSSSVTFSVPDDHYHHQYYAQRSASFAESEWDYEPTLTTISPTTFAMARALRSVKTFKKSWDADKALTSTYKGNFGKYQLRAYIFLALGYAITVAWLTEMPVFALLPPRWIDCTPIYINETNITDSRIISGNLTTIKPLSLQSSTRIRKGIENSTNNTPWNNSSGNVQIDVRKQKAQPTYNYSRDYGRSVLTDFKILCDPFRVKLPNIMYIIGLILGGLIFGYIADHSGRKMVLLGSMWTACGLSIFQLLSEDYISYVFFIFFVGMAIGAVQVITVPYVIEMFSTKDRAIFGLLLTAAVFLLDLIIPGLAFLLKNWKILQGVVSVPLIITAVLYWITEESMFWFTTQKDYVTAVLSLTKIARNNGINFEERFGEARDFLRGKRSKGIQCDFQPLLRLEDIKSLGSKYPDFDMVDLQATGGKKNTCSERFVQVLTGHHYYPTLSTFYPTDFLHSKILSIYLLVMCGLWFVSSVTEYSLESFDFTEHLSNDFFLNYLFTHLIQVASFLVAFPMVYKWGRRWPTFCFFLIAEVCLLGSYTIKSNSEESRLTILVIYFLGKFASRATYVVILLYTCEIFPTGLRCTTLGLCYTFRLIGTALASRDVAGLNDRTARLIYGVLALILGSMALLLPETKKFPLPRTMIQVEMIPTSVSKKFRRQRPAAAKRNIRPDGTRPDGGNVFNDAASSISGVRSVRFGPYDNQSTLHSVYELQEYGQDDTIQSNSGRYPRRMDLRNPNLFQPSNIEAYRQQTPIAEDVEYDDGEDVDDDRTRYAQQQRRNQQQRHSEQQIPLMRTDSDNTAKANTKQSSSDSPSQLEVTAQIQSGDVTGDRSGVANVSSTSEELLDKGRPDENLSQTPTQVLDENNAYPPNISEEENYFSEHC